MKLAVHFNSFQSNSIEFNEQVLVGAKPFEQLFCQDANAKRFAVAEWLECGVLKSFVPVMILGLGMKLGNVHQDNRMCAV